MLFIRVVVMSVVPIFAAPSYAAFLPGDILLHSARCGVYCDSIRAVTHSPIDHVAVVVKSPKERAFRFGSQRGVEPGEIIEAWTPTAKRTSLDTFVARDNGRYIQLRLRPEYHTEAIINSVVKEAKLLLGRPYDYHFEAGDEKVYCSELARDVYQKAGIEVGRMQKLSSFDRGSAEAYWTEHFEGNIPWDRLAVSPASIIDSKKFEVIHSSYN